MSKKLKNLKWAAVALEGFSSSVTQSLDGFGGLEECTNYKLAKEPKTTRKQKSPKKRKSDPGSIVPSKKIKLSNGFKVESCNIVKPSQSNEYGEIKSKKHKRKTKKNKKTVNNVQERLKSIVELKKNKTKQKLKLKLGEDISQNICNLTPEDMLSWAEFKLPEPILKALAELGFKQPTKIQQLCLPVAIHGRRDILGAAETGSGKTLAFALPILTGIIKLKEKAAQGHNVYDLPYKKSSNKKKDQKPEPQQVNNKRKKKIFKNDIVKESSEDGYGSNESEVEDDHQQNDDTNESESDNENNQTHTEQSKGDEFIEEIEVPIKKESSVDEGNDSDDGDYIHLSDILDSDLNDSSSEEGEKSNKQNETDVINDDSDFEDEENSTGEEEMGNESEVDENNQGIGCVKVIDNIEMPTPAPTRTGKPLYALIITPTRELAIQVSNHIIAVAKYTGIRVATVVGGMAGVKQERVLRCGPEVVVATPGRLWELASQGHVHLQQLDAIKFLVIDETDRMVERGHFEELTSILERVNADPARAATRQNFVFSATLTMVHDLPTHMLRKKVTARGKIINRKVKKMTPQQKIDRLVKMFGMTEPKVIDITQRNLGTAESLTESVVHCSAQSKDACLYYLVRRHPGRTIVFCNTIGCVKRLVHLLSILQCNPLPLHASMQQRQRLINLERFRDSARGLLICTDVAARGLDIPDIDHVVHYQVPKTAENYVHRSGRTARAHKEGLAIVLLEPAEGLLYSRLNRTLNRTSEVPQFPIPAASLSPLKAILSVARQIDRLELQQSRDAARAAWRERAATDMDIIIDDDDVPMVKPDASAARALTALRRELRALLARPLLPRGTSHKFPAFEQADAQWAEHNALQVMKEALDSGVIKKDKRKSKNAPLLKLQKHLQKSIK